MSRTEFLQGLKSELEGRVPYSVIQENLRYYDSYIAEEVSKGQSEDQVIESLGGPRIIARTIVDAALDMEDRPDGYQSFGTDDSYRDARSGQEREEQRKTADSGGSVHYVDFSKWYVRLLAGLAVFLAIFLLMTIFFGIIGFVGTILAAIWPVLLVIFVILSLIHI